MASIHDVALYGLLLIFAWLSYVVLEPFIQYVILAFLTAFLFHPWYKKLDKKMWSGVAATIMLLIVMLILIIPSVYLAGTVIAQATDTYQDLQQSGMLIDESSLSNLIQQWTGYDLQDEIVTLFGQGRQAIKNAIPQIITSTGAFLLGLFIFFFVLYYAFREGPGWYKSAMEALPFKKKRREEVSEKIYRQSKALLYGQILTSIVIGLIVGVFLWIFGVPNAVFWGFVAIILGVIPVLGAPFVYVPAAAYLAWQGYWIKAIAMLLIITTIHLVIDNIVRPKLISKASPIHPTIVILGAIGGIAMMGIVGFLVGPLILSFFITLLESKK